MISVILGAGFSSLAGVPLASQLFDEEPLVDRITRRKLVARVISNWNLWREKNQGSPEQYLAHLETLKYREWYDAIWFVGLTIALKMGRVERVGGQSQPTITRHHIARTTQVDSHERFWTTLFRRTEDVAVLTTNYDILPERGLRLHPRPRVPRPGFNYGEGNVYLEGGGYPSYAHIQKVVAEGRVPLFKLHGSVSWSVKDGKLLQYHDCRPAIRGDAAILAPITRKRVPTFLEPIWERAATVLSSSRTWIVVGYSLPTYDEAILELFGSCAKHGPAVHFFDPNDEVAQRAKKLLPVATVFAHGGLPACLGDLESLELD